MYNKKITPYDNKDIIIWGGSLMMCDIRFQANRQICSNNMKFLSLNIFCYIEVQMNLNITILNSSMFNSSQIKYVTSNASTIKVTTFKLNH